jgi:hypothetical protein
MVCNLLKEGQTTQYQQLLPKEVMAKNLRFSVPVLLGFVTPALTSLVRFYFPLINTDDVPRDTLITYTFLAARLLSFLW